MNRRLAVTTDHGRTRSRSRAAPRAACTVRAVYDSRRDQPTCRRASLLRLGAVAVASGTYSRPRPGVWTRILCEWDARPMDFFSSLPDTVEIDEEDDDDSDFERDQPDWFGEPSSVLGAPVAVSGVIHRSEHVFIGLEYATAYRAGVAFGIQIAARRGDWSRVQWEAIQGAVFGHPRPPHKRNSGELRIGAELADGTRFGSEPPWQRIPRNRPPDGPVLVDHGGDGSGGRRTMRSHRELWLWPLPDGDTLDLVFAWPELDVPVTRYSVNADELRAASTAEVPHWDH
jgi:hypothetical protein